MYHLKKIVMTFVLVVFGGFFLNGCNTVQGVGKDLEAGGKAISKAASSNQSTNHKQPKVTTTTAANTSNQEMEIVKDQPPFI